MKGLNKKERYELYEHLSFNKKYTSYQLSTLALKLFQDKSIKVLRTHLGSNMVEDGLLERPAHNTYIKALLPTQTAQVHRQELPLNSSKNPQDFPEFIEVQPPYVLIHNATDRQLADELRRRGYEVEAKKITTI